MKLYWNSTAVHDLVTAFQVLGRARTLEPAEHPQRARVRLRVKFWFLQTAGYQDNAVAVAAVRELLKTTPATLLWTSTPPGVEEPFTYLETVATCLDDGQPEQENAQGTWMQTLEVSFEYFEALTSTGALTATYAGVELGHVEGWRESYSATMVDEMRTGRRRAAGQVSARGRWQADATLSVASRQAALVAKKAALLAALTASGPLVCGTFNQTVRVVEFTADINQPKDYVEWALTAGWTRFPNESDHTITEWTLAPTQNQSEGTVGLAFAGRIVAATEEAALAKLAALRAALVSSAYWQASRRHDPRSVEVKSAGVTECSVFTELNFDEQYQKHSGDVMEYSLRVATSEEAREGYSMVTKSGMVRAKGSTAAAAYAVAAAKALELAGPASGEFLLGSELNRTDKLWLSDGPVMVTVEFSYRYRAQGARTWCEFTAVRNLESFGPDTEQVSGSIKAPTLAAASAYYESNVKGLAAFSDALILSERRPRYVQETIAGVATQEGRYEFAFTLHREKAATATAMTYALEPVSDYLTLTKTTSVNGTVWGISAAVAEAFVSTFLNTLSLGVRRDLRVRTSRRSGPKVDGAASVDVFDQVDFSATYEAQLTGVDGILQCEVAEQVTYSATRWVEQAIPDGPSLIQDCGTTVATRVVQGSVTATTEATGRAWALDCRTRLLVGADGTGADYEQPQQIGVAFKFLPLTDGKARGSGANVKVFVVNFAFSELMREKGL